MESKKISSDNIKTLFNEVKDLFPESNYLKGTDYSYSESNKRLNSHGFRIGMSCVVISEHDEHYVDIGTWNNVYNEIDISKKNLSLEEAKSWLLESAKHAQKQAADQAITDRKDKITIALLITAALVSAYIYFS